MSIFDAPYDRVVGTYEDATGEFRDSSAWTWPLPVQALVDQVTPGPDAEAKEWLPLLLNDLARQRYAMHRVRRYYIGDQPLKFASQKFRETFHDQLREQCDNWMDLVISATSERMLIAGMRMGTANASGEADDFAWNVWQANSLDCDASIAHVNAMVCGVSYICVGPQEDGSTDTPRVTVEDPDEVVVRYAPGNRRKRVAALKTYAEDDQQVAWVLLPDRVRVFRRKLAQAAAAFDTSPTDFDESAWEEDVDAGRDNPLGVVPVVPMLCRPDARGRGASDLLTVLSLQDEINKLTADIMIASEFASFRQRVVLGWDPAPGEELISAASRLWTFNSADVKVDEFSATDVRPLIEARESAIQRLAARTRTPPHYLLGQSGAFPSGESLKATETGLVAKVRERQRWFGESWEEAMRLAVQLARGPQDGDHRAEVVWADPESRSEGELVDALVKMRTLAVPYEDLWERYGASPQQIEQWRAQRGLPEAPPVGATGDRVTNPPDPPADL